MQTVAGLSALTRLRLAMGKHTGCSSSMPTCKELASLHSTSIEDLTVDLQQVLEVGGWTAD